MIHIGHYKNIGYRDTMEDYMIINSNPKFCFFSILDGHGGSSCVKYLKVKLYNIILEQYTKYNGSNISKILYNSYQILDQMFLENYRISNRLSGSTACSLLIDIRNNKYWIANTGDSRIIVLVNNNVIQLSKDHKPYSKDEYNRIVSQNGFVYKNRLGGILAMSRAFGNIRLKTQGLIVTPDILTGTINKNYKYFVIASDGLYDVMTNTEIVNFINYHIDKNLKLKDISKKLVQYAINNKHSSDNVSVIIVLLNYHI